MTRADWPTSLCLVLTVTLMLHVVLLGAATQSSVCSVNNEITLSCNNRGLIVVPSPDADQVTTTVVSLQDNSISTITDTSFRRFPKAKIIKLSNNNISDIYPNSFSGINLDDLYLKNNSIVSLKARTFFGAGIGELDLGINQIESLHNYTFEGLNRTTTLLLDNNRISSIEPGTFSWLTSISIINLSGNRISSLDDIFHGLITLEGIYLRNNTIQNISRDAFATLGNLTSLILSDNTQIESIDMSRWPRSFEVVYLGNNCNLQNVTGLPPNVTFEESCCQSMLCTCQNRDALVLMTNNDHSELVKYCKSDADLCERLTTSVTTVTNMVTTTGDGTSGYMQPVINRGTHRQFQTHVVFTPVLIWWFLAVTVE